MPKNKQKQKQGLKSSIKNIIKIALGTQTRKRGKPRRRRTQARPTNYPPPPPATVSVSTPVYFTGAGGSGGEGLLAGLSKILGERSNSIPSSNPAPVFPGSGYRLGEGSGAIPTNSSSLLEEGVQATNSGGEIKQEEESSSIFGSVQGSLPSNSPRLADLVDTATQTSTFRTNDTGGISQQSYDADNPFSVMGRTLADGATRDELFRIYLAEGGNPAPYLTQTGLLKTSVLRSDLEALARQQVRDNIQAGKYGRVLSSRGGGGGGGGGGGAVQPGE
jgi:hypothetical protein